MNGIVVFGELVLRMFMIGTLNLYSPGWPVPPAYNVSACAAIVLTPEAIDGPWIEQEMFAAVAQNFDFSTLFLWGYGKAPELRHTIGLRVTEHKARHRWMLYYGCRSSG